MEHSQSRWDRSGQAAGAVTHQSAGSSSPTAGTGGRPRTGRSRSRGAGTPGPRRPNGCPADFRTPDCKARGRAGSYPGQSRELPGSSHTISTPFLWSLLPALCTHQTESSSKCVIIQRTQKLRFCFHIIKTPSSQLFLLIKTLHFLCSAPKMWL